MADITSLTKSLDDLVKTLEAGSYNAPPSSLVQGAALQIEDLSPVIRNVTFKQKQLILQKKLTTEDCKSLLAQFDRILGYGIFGGSAQLEGAVGQEETGEYVRAVVPMAFYSHVRRVTLPANMVATVDGKKASEREAENAALKIAADFEFDLFRGKSDFSNAGVFDGNPFAMPALPNMLSIEAQIRASDGDLKTRDAMFAEYGSDLSIVVSGGGTLTQNMVEDASVRATLNHSEADTLLIDPLVLSAYNKIHFGNQRIVLAGSAQDATGNDLRKQWTSGNTIKLEASRFLTGKFKPAPARSSSPAAPSIVTAEVAGTTSFAVGNSFYYFATSVNELGESPLSAAVAAEVIAVAGNYVTVTITPAGGTAAKYFNVYRTNSGAAASTARFIGRVANSGAATTVFYDLGNKLPGFVTGLLWDSSSMGIKELAPYSRAKLAQVDLTEREAHFRFATIAVYSPRSNVLIDNLIGSL